MHKGWQLLSSEQLLLVLALELEGKWPLHNPLLMPPHGDWDKLPNINTVNLMLISPAEWGAYHNQFP